MAKQTNNAKAARNEAAPSLDWNKEAARMEASAKEKGGTRGDQLGRMAKVIVGAGAAVDLLRASAGERGAQAFIDMPRNVLAKLPKLANCVAAGTPWCSAGALVPGKDGGSRKEDASVAVALGALGAGDERQKGIIAQAIARYPGGANAQMPAALDACAFVGIVARKPGGARNAEYTIVDRKRADALIPKG